MLEYVGQRRIRAVSALDGSFVDEWTSDQDVTRVITGQYDWTNDHVWLGDLRGSGLFRYRRDDGPATGQLRSPDIGPAAAWRSVRMAGNGIHLRIEGRHTQEPRTEDHNGGNWVEVLQDSLPAGGVIDLTGIDATQYRYLRLVARIDSAAGLLAQWGADFAHASDLEVADVVVDAGTILVAVRNRGLGLSAPASAHLLTKSGHVLATGQIGAVAAGDTALVHFVEPPEAATQALRVWLATGDADADPTNDRADVPHTSPFERVVFRTWPQGQRLHNGDGVAAGQAILVQAAGRGRIALHVDGVPTTADSSWLEAAGARAVLRLAAGRRRLEAQLLAADGATHGAELRLKVAAVLTLRNALAVPNPVGRDGTRFTCYVSGACQVTVEIYSVGGRRIRRLDPVDTDGGFVVLPWDGRDGDGQPLATGSYLYVIHARSEGNAPGDHNSARRGVVVVAP